MPTTRQRHLLTETDEIAQAIDAAAASFPGQSRADILRELVRLGSEALANEHGARRRTVAEHAGRHPNLFAPDYLEELREEWPE